MVLNMAVPFPVIVIFNVTLYGVLLIRVVVALVQKLLQESRVPSVKRKLVHVVLTCFCLFRFAWSLQEIMKWDTPRTIHFFLDTTAMCLFFTAFIIVFFHLLKKLSGWSMSRSTFFLGLALLLNMDAYMLGITIDSALTHKNSDSPIFKAHILIAGSIVIASYSILNAMGFLVIGIRVWRNMSLLNKITRPSLSQDQRRKGGIMIGITIVSCIVFFAMRLVVFTLKPDFIIDNDLSFKFTSYLFGYWLAEAPTTMVMLYVMKRSYKSTPLLDDTRYKTGTQAGSFVTSPMTECASGAIRSNQLRSTFSVTDFASPPNREDSVIYNPGEASGLPKLRVEFSVSCTFPMARRPLVALMPYSWRQHGSPDRSSLDKCIDRTEIRSKPNTYCLFSRTLLFVGDLNSLFSFAVFDNPVDTSDSQALQYVGEAQFTINEAHRSSHSKITRDILMCDRRGDVMENNGSITIHIVMEEPCVRKRSTITKSYLLSHDEDEPQLHVREELTEARFTFQCAYQLLKILIPLRHQELIELNKRQTQLGDQAVHRNSLSTQDMGDIFGNMMIGIMEGNEETSTFQWFTTLLQHFTKHFESLKAASDLYKSYRADYKDLSFKPSTYKNDTQLGFIATNLHSQELQIFSPEKFSFHTLATSNPLPDIRYETITFGAPAAHILKFKHGIRGLQHRWRKALQFLKSNNCDPQQASTLVREIEALNLEIRQRHDVVMCQSVAALVTSFSKKIENSCQMLGGQRFLEQIGHIGFLFQVESLLSTNGPEIGMLEDMDVAIKDLSIFSFVLEDADVVGLSRVRFEKDETETADNLKDAIPPFEGSPLRIIIKLSIARVHFEKLPENLQKGQAVRVYPLLFTQGINEQQTIANTVGDSSLQEDINKENMQLFMSYFKNYGAYLQQIGAQDEIESVETELLQVEKIIAISRREKNVEILSRTSDLVRRILGGRATCCKSAKDRTSMSITWEQARILERHHNLPKTDMPEVIQVMRSAGVRRENAFKNIGVDKYAFNQFQIMLIPEIYKPPKGTEGARVT